LMVSIDTKASLPDAIFQNTQTGLFNACQYSQTLV
ncbi:MAG: hypothetical protein ACI8R0_002761, partial [Alteromonadales bacterium]